MINETICICSGQEPDCGDSQGSWFLIAAYVKKKHSRSVDFITNDADLVRQYIDVVKPFMVYQFRFDTRDQADKFIKNYYEKYLKIDLYAFRFAADQAVETSF